MKSSKLRKNALLYGFLVVAAVVLVLSFFIPSTSQVTATPAAENLFYVGPFGISNSFVMMLLVMAGLVLFAYFATRKIQLVPGRLQSMLEMLVEMVLGLCENAAGRRAGRIILPLVGTIFIYVLIANWVTLLPGFGTVWLSEVSNGVTEQIPLLRAANADINMTLAMAIFAFLAFQYAGLKAHGIKGRIKEMATPLYLSPLLFPIHIISELSRLISLSFRLFGNTFAGEILLILMVGLAGPGVVLFMGLEMLFAYIQALVFSVLTLVYTSLALGGFPADHGPHESHSS
ncbi:MAG: F0F1 ATP synthase subunit A [Chloroflexi bacterium]|nr:F0F1 ATP synthase subunit A [Chloroflexota bacterium]